jgi:hypothetical protein
MSTDEVKAKSEKFSDLAKKNELSHHLGMTGYADKRPRWRQEEREAEAAGQSYPLQGVDERSRDYFYARQPKKLKEATDRGGEEGFAHDQGGQGMRGVRTSQESRRVDRGAGKP